MNRLDIIDMLDRLHLEYSVVDHPPAETVEEIDSFRLPNAEAIVKNLFLRDDKKRNYYLLVVRKDKTVNLKELRASLGVRPLSFASEADLFLYLGLKKGAVTPLGILNDAEHKVRVLVDEDVLDFPAVGVHPNENTATVWLSPQDLLALLKNHGNSVDILRIE